MMEPGAVRADGSRIRVALAVMGLLAVIAPPAAHAYIDPMSGSIVFQVVVAGILGALLTIRRWWDSAVRLVRGVWARVAGR
jgi:hypothetical protein